MQTKNDIRNSGTLSSSPGKSSLNENSEPRKIKLDGSACHGILCESDRFFKKSRVDSKLAMSQMLQRLDAMPNFKEMKELFKREVCKSDSVFTERQAVDEYRKITQESPMLMCVFYDDLECARALLAKGIDVDDSVAGGATALYTAISSGNFTLARYLVEQGGNMDKMSYGEITPRDVAKLLPELPDIMAANHRDEVELRRIAVSSGLEELTKPGQH